MSGVFDLIVDLQDRLDLLEARLERTFRHGTVTDVDGQKHRIRMQIGGTSDQPHKSPWIPYSQIAGARKNHSMPSVGQQMTMISPDGDIDQGFAIPLIWSNNNQSPSTDPNTDVDQRGQTTVTVTDGTWSLQSGTITIKGSTITVTGSNVTVTASGAGNLA